jgi:hypothetical protein
VTYISEAQIEARAAELWRRHSLEPGFDVERLLDDLGLGLVWEVVDDHGAEGAVLGQLIPEKQLVVLNERHIEGLEDKQGRLRRYTVGHEVGHWVLHADAARLGNLSLFDGDRIRCRNGSPDPVERQAEMFSAALLTVLRVSSGGEERHAPEGLLSWSRRLDARATQRVTPNCS